MRLAVIQPEQALPCQKAQGQAGIICLKPHQNAGQLRRDIRDGSDDQFPRHRFSLAADTVGKLGKLVFGCFGHSQQVAPCLCRVVTARMALEQLFAQALFKAVNMADNRGVMHAQHFSGPRYGSHPRHQIGGLYLVPIFQTLAPALTP
jgi:hypothetical protein